jgi:hypothetical protein
MWRVLERASASLLDVFLLVLLLFLCKEVSTGGFSTVFSCFPTVCEQNKAAVAAWRVIYKGYPEI